MDLAKRAEIGRRNLLREYGGDMKMTARVLAGCLEAVKRSFRTCPMRVKTTAELRRRTDKAVELAMELRFASHWSTFKIADQLARALEIWLQTGAEFTPDAIDKRTFWAPDATKTTEPGAIVQSDAA
jgi:hypothetical protein